MINSLKDKFFKDDQGNVVLGQRPNILIVVWAVSSILGYIFDEGGLNTLFSLISFVAILTWSILELFQGVNIFRRLLGLAVLFVSMYSRL